MSEVTTPQLRFSGFSGDWRITRFGKELLESKLGGNYANSETVTEHPLIKMGNLGRGEMNLRKLEYVRDGEVINPDDQMKEGDLFFNTRNTLDLVGKVAIWRSELPTAYYNSNLMRITFGCNHFMNYRLNSFNGIKSLRRLATGTTSVAAIYSRDLLKMKISLPALPEQRKIADFLTAVDGRIAQLERKKALLEDYKKGVMQQLFTQAIRFKDDHGKDFPEWEEKKLGEVGSFKSGVGFSESEQGGKEGTPFYKVSDMNLPGNETEMNSANHYVTEEQISKNKYKVFTDASLVFAKVGAAIFLERKRVATNYLLDNNMMAFTPSFDIKFAKHLFSTVRLSRFAQVGALPSYNASDLKGIKVSIPSSPAEQTKIAEFLTALDRKIEGVGSQIEGSKGFKRGLLQQMFV